MQFGDTENRRQHCDFLCILFEKQNDLFLFEIKGGKKKVKNVLIRS